MDVKWDVVGLGVRYVRTVGKVESDVEEIEDFLLASIVILRPCSLKMVHRSFLISSTWRGRAFVIPRPSSLYKPKLLPCFYIYIYIYIYKKQLMVASGQQRMPLRQEDQRFTVQASPHGIKTR